MYSVRYGPPHFCMWMSYCPSSLDRLSYDSSQEISQLKESLTADQLRDPATPAACPQSARLTPPTSNPSFLHSPRPQKNFSSLGTGELWAKHETETSCPHTLPVEFRPLGTSLGDLGLCLLSV